MKLRKLLEQNALCQSADGLDANFGDHYLIRYNRIYANIRGATLKAGFKYSTEGNPGYLALPLSQLDRVLKDKRIPLIDNVSVLREVETRISGGALWDEVTDNLRKNHVFHESCHAVSLSLSSSLSPSDGHEKILKTLLEESFSNTCELLAVKDAEDALHRIFFEWNSYICMFEDRTHLKNAMNEFGEDSVFRFTLLCYLHANFLAEHLNEKQLDRVISVVFENRMTDVKKLKVLRSLSKITFQLNPRFREVTTGFYLRLNGAKAPLTELLNFDFMKILETKIAYSNLVGRYSHLALQKI